MENLKKEQERQDIIDRVTTGKSNLKKELSELYSKGILRKQWLDSIFSLLNNYFVFKSLNNETMPEYIDLANKLIEPFKQLNQYDEDHYDKIRSMIIDFSFYLPKNAQESKPHFYNKILPDMLSSLKSQIELLNSSSDSTLATES